METLTSIDDLLEQMVAMGASDLHITVASPPAFRVRGHIARAEGFESLSADDTRSLLYRVLSSEQQKVFELNRQLDFAYSIPGLARFRVNVYYQREAVGAAFRLIPQEIKTLEELSLPPTLHQLACYPRGLVLVTGPTGSGKSTTLAAIIDLINSTKRYHVVTIEDPIEFLHTDDKSSISQREIGIDTSTFADALRAALRQDPDVILVGEIRDEITMDIALKAAETGHLVLSTLHTPDVTRTVGRMLALAPKGQPGSADELRERIGDSLQGIIAQRLLPKRDGAGLVLAAEVLVATGTVRESIKRPETNPALKELMEKGVHPYGMQTFEMHLKQLVAQGLLDKDVAKAAAGF
jgi:twitching motility protein PilT